MLCQPSWYLCLVSINLCVTSEELLISMICWHNGEQLMRLGRAALISRRNFMHVCTGDIWGIFGGEGGSYVCTMELAL